MDRPKRAQGVFISPTVKRTMPKGVKSILYAQRNLDVIYIAQGNWYYHRIQGTDYWTRALGLTTMMQRALWPNYWREAPTVVEREKQMAEAYKSKQSKHKPAEATIAPKKRAGGMQYYSTKDIMELASRKPHDKTGTDLGERVHRELLLWTKLGLQGCGMAYTQMNEWFQDHTMRAIEKLQAMGLQMAYAELTIYDPSVPVATSLDLIGWDPKRPDTIVVIEIKTGSSYNKYFGNAPMEGESARRLLGSPENSPYNQAMAQLAISRAIVEKLYAPPHTKVVGLLLWINRADGAVAKWMPAVWEVAGRMMLGELRVHMQERRSEKANVSKRKRTASPKSTPARRGWGRGGQRYKKYRGK